MPLLTTPRALPLAAMLGFEPLRFALIARLASRIGFAVLLFGLLFATKGVAPPRTTGRGIDLAAVPRLLRSAPIPSSAARALVARPRA